MTTIFVNLLAFATLLSSVFTITSKNPVISVIFLISTFVSGALYLILIGITFLGISYIIVYVGAIAVLFLFVIMLLNIRIAEITEVGTQYFKVLPLAFVISSLFLYFFLSVMPQTSNDVAIISYLVNYLTNFNS
jgi:NADH-ubiquinone oxidoreductase chain 6